MAVTINFNTLTASTNNLGKIGEHNSTELEITYTNSDERCSQYRIAFATGKEVILSEAYTEMPINIYLWQQLTKCPRISIQVLCYDDDGEYISKSAKMSGFYFEPSIGNTTVEADGSNPDLAGEITDLDTRLTSAEADIDTLDAGKQSKITASNKLPYSLISGTPTIPTIPTNVSAFTNDAGYLTSHQDISGKQDTLVSGTNIKTINNESILGSGNITIQGGGSSDPIEMVESEGELVKDVTELYADYESGKKLLFMGKDVTNFIKGEDGLEGLYNWMYHDTFIDSEGEIEYGYLKSCYSWSDNTYTESSESMNLFASYISNDNITSTITDSTTTTLLPNVGAVKGYVDAQISTVLNTSFGGDS